MIIGKPTKPYDGTAGAILTPDNFSMPGLVAAQSFVVTQIAGTYNSPNVATATTVTASLSAIHFTAGPGTLASNYALPTTASGPGAISPLTVAAGIIGAPTRPYDGTASATLSSDTVTRARTAAPGRQRPSALSSVARAIEKVVMESAGRALASTATRPPATSRASEPRARPP